MLRHGCDKQPTEVVETIQGRLTLAGPDVTPTNGQEDMEVDNEYLCPGMLEAGGSSEQLTHEEASEDCPVRRRRNKRSLIWRHFERLDSLDAARCRICMKKLQCFEGGSTSNLHRHMSKRHPGVFSQLLASGDNPPPSCSSQGSIVNGDTLTPSNTVGVMEKKMVSVEATLEDGYSDSPTKGNDVDFDSAVKGISEVVQGRSSEQLTHEEASEDCPVRRRRNKRSLIWRHFERLDSLDAARCRICMKKLQCFEGGSTSNLHRHMSKRHPGVFSQLLASGDNPPPSCSSQGSIVNGDTLTPSNTVGVMEKKMVSVEATLEDGYSDSPTKGNDVDFDSAVKGISEAVQGRSSEQLTHEEASEDCPVRRRRNKRSLIWRHFEHLDSSGAARCRICMKKLQCFEGGSTSNLHRHMSKRHPGVFGQLLASGDNPPPSCSSQGSTSSEAVNEKRTFSGVLKVSRKSGGERRVFRRERELIEALRRVQKEEARALECQKKLLEKLCAANAKEAAAERQQIESLRKAQQEEAKDLSRQREELQKEKAELQKKWEELQQEREGLLLFSRGQQVS